MDAIRMLLENALESQQNEPYDDEKMISLYQDHHSDMMSLHHMKDAMSMFPKAREHMQHDYHDQLEQAAKTHAAWHSYATKFPKETQENYGISKPHNFVDAIKHSEEAWRDGQEDVANRQFDTEYNSYVDSHPQ